MPLQSTLPASFTPAVRLKNYLRLARELSLQHSPGDLVRVFRAHAQSVVPYERSLTLTRLQAEDCEVRLLGSSFLGVEFDPWVRPDELPRLRSEFLCRLMEAGHPVKVDDLLLPADDPFAPHAAGMRSLLAAPVFEAGRALHMVVMLRSQPRAFTLEELSTLLLTANLVGQASAHSELAAQLSTAYTALDREFRQIGEIQRELLPNRLPQIAGLALAAFYETSTRAGGDYYDFFELPDGQWGIFLADVSGHGAPAAVVMARIHALLHAPLTACPWTATSPIEVLNGLNHSLVASSQTGSFVTAFYGILEPATRTLRYSLAGHNPPRWLQATDRRVVPLAATDGLPLAIVEPIGLTENTVRFAARDRLLLYTDGIVETFNAQREQFGLVRLDAALLNSAAGPEQIIEAVVADVRAFSHGAAPADDRTLVVLAFE